MFAAPKLKTVSLLSPLRAERVVLTKSVTALSASPFEGQPDANSPAQRTLHQALANRLLGQANVYHCLREYGFRTVWGFRAEALPTSAVALALIHQGQGPKFAVILKSAQSSAFSASLVDDGWHVLIVNPTSLVQSPQEVVSDVLTVLHHVAGLPVGTGETAEKAGPHGDGTTVSADAPATPTAPGKSRVLSGKPPASAGRPRSRAPFLLVLCGLAVAAASLYRMGDQLPVVFATPQGGGAYTGKVAAVQVTKEGHAAVTFADGRKAFVPARTVRQHPNLLHDLIVAWRQGRTMEVMTTSTQHLRYGREMGIKAPTQPSATAAARSTTAKKPR